MYDIFKITVFEYVRTHVYDEVSRGIIICGGDEFVRL